MARKGYPLPEMLAPGTLDNNQQSYVSMVARALGIQNRIPGHLDPKEQIGFTLDDFTRPEFAYLRRMALWSMAVEQNAVALQSGYVEIVPVPGTLILVERIVVANVTAAAIAYRFGMALGQGAGTVAVTAVRDTRYFPGQPVTQVRFGTTAAPISPVSGYVILPAGSSQELVINAVVGSSVGGPPPLTFKVINTAVNTACTVTLHGYERPLLPSEL